eukprot:15051258-Heterocapsa_arctica.AAC.1
MQAQFAHSCTLFMLPGPLLSRPAPLLLAAAPAWIAFDARAAQAIRTRKSAAPPAGRTSRAGRGTPGEPGSQPAGSAG